MQSTSLQDNKTFAMIKDRVMQLLKAKGIAKESFFTEIGISSSNFRGNASKTPLNSTTIRKIVEKIPDLNCEWLITGEGEMLKDPNSTYNQEFLRSFEKIADSVELLASSNNNVSHANKILAETNAQLITQLSALMERIQEKLFGEVGVPYPVPGQDAAKASDVKKTGAYKSRK